MKNAILAGLVGLVAACGPDLPPQFAGTVVEAGKVTFTSNPVGDEHPTKSRFNYAILEASDGSYNCMLGPDVAHGTILSYVPDGRQRSKHLTTYINKKRVTARCYEAIEYFEEFVQ